MLLGEKFTWQPGVVRLHLSRDSVAAGDDADSHDLDVEVDEPTGRPGASLRESVGANHTPSTGGGSSGDAPGSRSKSPVR